MVIPCAGKVHFSRSRTTYEFRTFFEPWSWVSWVSERNTLTDRLFSYGSLLVIQSINSPSMRSFINAKDRAHDFVQAHGIAMIVVEVRFDLLEGLPTGRMSEFWTFFDTIGWVFFCRHYTWPTESTVETYHTLSWEYPTTRDCPGHDGDIRPHAQVGGGMRGSI